MKKVISLFLMVSMVSMMGCAGRPANPVRQDQVGDNQKTCDTLQTEMNGIQSQIQSLMPQSDKTGKNVGLGIGGLFLLGIPWFFMDLTNAEKNEISAYNTRYSRLQTIASQKKCAFLAVTPDAPESTPKASASPMPTSNLSNPVKKLEDLNTMLKKGLISQADYDTKKTEILNSM